MKSNNTLPIDFIVYWVDGNDPVWQAKRNQFKVDKGQDNSVYRYRDWDNLQYLFRGIERFAPWVNRVFFVSDNQIPAWMNVENPKLTIVDHRDFIPEEYLPTFCSRSIEVNFHRIKGLSEQFVVFNDDFFLTNSVEPEDFFQNGKPVDMFMEFPVLFGGDFSYDVFTYGMVNSFSMLGRHFDRVEYKKRLRSKILSPKYGLYFFYNLYMYLLPIKKFFGLQTPHICRPYLKSSYEKLWGIEGEFLDRVSRDKFRSKNGANLWMFRMYNILEGNFVPANIYKIGHCYSITDDDEGACRDIIRQKYKMICLNDKCEEEAFDRMKVKLQDSFQKILPEKSSFEK